MRLPGARRQDTRLPRDNLADLYSILYGSASGQTRGPGRAMEGKEHFSERFLRPRMAYRQPDGGEWGGQDLENATSGAVTRSYVANLKKAA